MLQQDTVRSAGRPVGTAVLSTLTRATRRRSALVLGVVGAAVGIAGAWIPSYWGDEAATVLSAGRSWPSLLGMLGSIDGVHGLYYALMHVWIGVFGTSELATRAPSAIAVGFLVGGTVGLTRAFTDDRTAVLAGVAAIVLPRTTYMASEARSYAIGACAAVWVTLLLVRLVQTAARRRAWIWYGIAIAASMYLFLYLGLLLAVHALFLAAVHRDRLAAWARAAGLGLLLASPIVVIGYLQRQQIGFLARRRYATASNVLVKQWFGHPVVAVLAWTLVAASIIWLLVALIRRDRSALGRQQLTLLAITWLVLPSSILLIGNAWVAPMYNVRYLSFCAPAAAILISLGAVAIGRWIAPRHRRLAQTALIAALVVACLPVYLGQRTTFAKDGGSDWRAVAAYVAGNAHDGDVVLFDQSTKPSRDPRLALDLNPSAFRGLHDVARTTAYQDRAGLWDEVAANADLVGGIPASTPVWAVELVQGSGTPPDITALEKAGYGVQSSTRIHRTVVYRLIKE